MSANHLLVKFTNSNVDATNYQLCDVHVDSATAINALQMYAQIIAYFAAVSGGMGSGTRIAGLSERPSGTPGFTPLAFPTAAYAATVAAAASDGITVPAMASGYATSLGSGVLAPLGTSISVSERTATPGPTGRGRHFLPFVSQGIISAGGTVGTGHLAIIEDCANEFFLGVDPSGGAATAPIVSMDPVITNSGGLIIHAITLYRPQPVFSNLESRRR